MIKILYHKTNLKQSYLDINSKEEFPKLYESFNNAKEFIDKSLKGILINNKTIKSTKHPKVSAIIPIYNCDKTITRAIRSIQNQNIINIEIILVNDFSTDETLSMVEEFQKEDPRIKIINNQRNMGILYSRSIGALSAKGEYIFPLDNDDMLLDEDSYSTITQIADRGNFDLIGFKAVYSNYGPNILTNQIKENYFSDFIENSVLFQPELSLYPFRPGKKLGQYDIFDVLLWTKCIKTKIYQKALKKLGKENYSRFMILYEDYITIYILFNTAQSMKYIGKYGVLHIKTRNSGSKRKFTEDQIIIFQLYFIDTVIEFDRNSFQNRKLLVHLIIYLLEKKNIKKLMENNVFNKNFFISCIGKILSIRYISSEDKEEIRKRAIKLNFLEKSE